VAEVDLGLSVIITNDYLVGETIESLVFGVGKRFDCCVGAGAAKVAGFSGPNAGGKQ
jgi:hypothetical protein